MGSAAAFNDDLGWASEAFLDHDFDDDDDAFFSSAAAGGGGVDARSGGVDKSGSPSAASSFGMAALTYGDAVESSRSMRGSIDRPTSPAFGDAADGLEGDDISDDSELLELDRNVLAPLRNPNSAHRTVANSCLMLHQQMLARDQNGSACVYPIKAASQMPMQVESSSIYHIQRYQRRIHRILSSLTTCLSSHETATCRILACRTLATVARASYGRLRFDARLVSDPLPSPENTRLEDECGNGVAYSLVVAAIEQPDDGVSSAALEALGRLTLDTHTDNLSAEVRGIAECASPNVFMYEDGSKSSWILEHSRAMKGMQTKVWEHVVFPRMQHILQRMSLYSSPHLLARAIPMVTAAFVHALTQGRDTAPSRRALQMGKASHGKRGWREVDAEGLADDYVNGILLPCFSGHHSFHPDLCDKSLKRAMAAAFVRMSSAAPHATWRLSACRHATTVLLQQLNEGMSPAASPAQASWNSAAKLVTTNERKSSPISSTFATAAVSLETLAGTAAMLVVALRGLHLPERATGLVAVLRATLLFLPLGMPLPCGAGPLDLPITTVKCGGQTSYCRLGRTGLLTEVALSVLLDGDSNASRTKVEGLNGRQSNKETGNGTRSALLQSILSSHHLAQVWDESTIGDGSAFHPVDELVWVFCSVAAQVGVKRERLFSKDTALAAEWSILGMVMLDSFASIVSKPRESSSPFASESRGAYNRLLAAMLKRCGSFPPTALSISEHVMPSALNHVSVDRSSPVEGSPSSQLDHVALALAKVSTKILFLRDKAKLSTSKVSGASIETTAQFCQLVALLVDAWLGRCITNHDTKESNDGQLEAGLAFLPLCHAEVESIVQAHRSIAREDDVAAAVTPCQILIACLEHVASVSELLARDGGNGEGEAPPGKDVAPLAVSMLNEIVKFSKEGASADTKQGSMLCYQVALDASNAIARITERIRNRPQSLPEDVASAFQASPLIAAINPKPQMTTDSNRGSVDHCARFLQNHARIAISRRTDSAAKALAPTNCSSGMLLSPKLIQPRNPLRIPSAFSYSSIEKYDKVPDATLLIPAKSEGDSCWKTVTVSGCSDPINLTLSHDIRRVRKSDSSEEASLVVTLKLYNTTPVPIRNGVRVDLRIANENAPYDRSTCVATSVYPHEIKGVDFVTWEVVLGQWTPGTLTLQCSVTFLELEQESHSRTRKWVSVGDDDEDPAEDVDDDDESVLDDVTLPFRPITISPASTLQPCPLVFFGGLSHCESNGVGCGDTAAFEFLWTSMDKHQQTLPFIFIELEEGASKSLRDTRKGYVHVKLSSSTSKDDSVPGCAFIAPNGSRILCTHRARGDTHSLAVRSDSSDLLRSTVSSILSFVFGAHARRIDARHQQPPSLPRPEHDFPSMTMPHRRPILS